MKSERRHKLQENALAHSLENLPKMGRESGSKLLLGMVTVLLVIVLIRYYLGSRETKKETIATELADARYYLGELTGDHTLERQAPVSPEDRKKLLDDMEKKVDAVLAETTEVPLVAQAKNIRADAYVQVAALGNPPEATTRPDLASRKPDDLLDEASRAYQEVLEMKEGLPATEAADAHFGLGAIAENRREWDKARTQYQAVAKDTAMPKAFTDYAALRLQVLDKISGPFVVGKPMTRPVVDLSKLPPTSTSGPTTSPSTGPNTGPTTAPAPEVPATGPAAPLAAPSTAPTTGPTTSGT